MVKHALGIASCRTLRTQGCREALVSRLSSAEAAPGASGGGSPLNPWKSTEVERGPEEGHLLTLPGPLQYKVLSSPTLNRGLGHCTQILSASGLGFGVPLQPDLCSNPWVPQQGLENPVVRPCTHIALSPGTIHTPGRLRI